MTIKISLILTLVSFAVAGCKSRSFNDPSASTFKSFCESKTLTSSQKSSMVSLIKNFKSVTNCAQLQAVLSATTEIDVPPTADPKKRIQDLSPLIYFPNLKQVKIVGHLVSDITPLYHLPQLEKIDLSNNQLVTIPAMESTERREGIRRITQLKNLRELNLGGNSIRNISGLEAIAGQLEVLDLSTNKIEEIAVIAKMHSLKSLNLSDNRLSAEQLNELNGLTKLDEVDLRGNDVGSLKCWLRASATCLLR